MTAGPESLRGPFLTPSGQPFIAPVSPVIRPLSIGAHTNVVFVTMSAETCNGLGICLPAGESQYDSSLSPVHPAPPADFTFAPPKT
ncbi:hypothetical protein [Rhodococcus daqingensis]|uniref:Uncharacterized protein n=1 Tax=Rhodococcus daqingensis TaxID=2479363 RepID=A0ABW2RYF8_9NOCA